MTLLQTPNSTGAEWLHNVTVSHKSVAQGCLHGLAQDPVVWVPRSAQTPCLPIIHTQGEEPGFWSPAGGQQHHTTPPLWEHPASKQLPKASHQHDTQLSDTHHAYKVFSTHFYLLHMWMPLWDLLEGKGGNPTPAEPAASKEQQCHCLHLSCAEMPQPQEHCTSSPSPPSSGNAQGFPSLISFPLLSVTHRGAVSGRTV